MGAQICTGPTVNSGNLNTSGITDGDCGPMLAYQGVGIVDPRQSFDINGKPGRFIRGFFLSGDILCLDGQPQAPVAAGIVAAAAVAVTTATTPATAAGLAAGFVSAALTLLGQSAPGSGNIAQNIPMLPYGLAPIGANVVTAPIALEFGYAIGSTIGTTVSASPTVTLATAANVKYFYVGQTLIIAGSGNAGGTIPLIASILTISASAGTLTLSTNALKTNASGVQIGSADPGGLFAFPYQKAGIDALWDPSQNFTRNLRVISSSASDTGYSLIVRGYDYAGLPMTEVIAVTANATAYGVKGWKYITQINLYNASSGTTVGNISVGTADTFGLPVRSDYFEYSTIYYNQATATAAPGNAGNGWVAADGTSPATNATGDTRGTIQLSAAGAGSNNYAGGAPNGTRRVVAFLQLPAFAAANSTNINYASMLGVTNFSG